MKGKNSIVAFLFFLIALNLSAQTKSPKRGFCGDLLNAADLQAASKYAWYYNWGQSATAAVAGTVKDYCDYVPMVWGSSYNKTALITYLTNHPEIKYLLAFNEPNFLQQANIGPRAAAALWPELQAIADQFNLKLVSPALNFSYPGGAVKENGVEYTDPVKYLDDFFAALPANSRVDYIAIHGYFDNAGALPWYIGLYSKYNKPLWLTEFNHSASGVTELSQQQFMVEALNYLEKEPKVFRYAWFLARSSQANTNLFQTGSTGKLTDLGLIFANISSYDATFYHTAGDTMESEHYVDMKGIHLVKVQDTDGILAAHDFDAGDWMDYNVDVATAGTYAASFRITSIWASSLSVYVGSKLLGTLKTPITGGLETWQTISMNLELAAGKQKIRIRTNGAGWKLNWWKLSRTTSAGKPFNEKKSGIHIYPIPASHSGNLTIETGLQNYTCEILNLQGNVLICRKNNNGNTSVKLTKLMAGNYICKVTGQDGCFTKGFVVI